MKFTLVVTTNRYPFLLLFPKKQNSYLYIIFIVLGIRSNLKQEGYIQVRLQHFTEEIVHSLVLMCVGVLGIISC